MRKFFKVVIRKIQKVLLTFFLTLLYFIGFGIAYLPNKLFKRKKSFWRKAVDYESNLEESYRGS